MSGLAPWIGRGVGLTIGVALVVGVLAFAWAAGTVLVLVFVAVILGAGLEPVVSWLRAWLHVGRGAAILLVYGMFIATVVAVILVIVPAAISQLGGIVAALPPFFDQARDWAATLRPAAVARTVTSVIDLAARSLPQGDAAPAGEQVVAVGATIAGGIMAILTLLTVVYFWLTERARLQRYTLAFLPMHRRARARHVWNTAEGRLGGWVRGTLILMATIGVATGAAYTLLGVPSALLLGLITALAQAIPIIGPILGGVPAVLVAATVSPQLALIVLGVYVVLQLIEGNVLVPIVMRNTVGISPFLVVLSVLAGAAAGGFIGALLAVPIAATAEVVLEGLQARDVPVAQDPTATPDKEDDIAPEDDETNAGTTVARRPPAGSRRPQEPAPAPD